MSAERLRWSVAAIMALMTVSLVTAQSNIDAVKRFAWSENTGWTNWRDANDTSNGVDVSGAFLEGFIWCANVGWINVGNGLGPYLNDPLDSATFGVNVDSNGALGGMAWGAEIGWVNFTGGALASPPQPGRIECNGRVAGYVWAENAGWINLDDAVHFLSLTPSAVPILCDMNHDGLPNGLDIQLFVDFVLSQATPDWRDVCSGDVESVPDMMIDSDDLAGFVSCLLS